MSIQKIARLAGVSVATVSRVLNNNSTVKEKNRKKVLQAITESNYQPNLLARQLRTARSLMILVMVSDISNPFCAEVVKGIEEEAEKNGFRILLCNSGSEIERSRSSLGLLTGKMVEGVITMNAFSKLPEMSQLIRNTPWVQCAEYSDNGDTSCVGIDDISCAQTVVDYLAKAGYRRIAMINHDLSYNYARLRQQGYVQQLAQQGLSWQAISYADALSFSAGKEATMRLLAENEQPDAIFTVSDTLAAGVMAAIQAVGLSVPEDIAVVGFDGTEISEMFYPPLTTLAQPSREMGREAFRLIQQRIEQPEKPPERVIMQAHLVKRASA